MSKEVKKVYIGMNKLLGRDVNDVIPASICLMIDKETFYFEFNDIDFSKFNPISVEYVMNRLILIDSGEPTMCYKSGNKNITYIRDNKEIIVEHIRNIILQYCKDCNIEFIGDISPILYTDFIRMIQNNVILKDYEFEFIELKTLLNFIDLHSSFGSILDINNPLRYYLKQQEDNAIVITSLTKRIYEIITNDKK